MGREIDQVSIVNLLKGLLLKKEATENMNNFAVKFKNEIVPK